MSRTRGTVSSKVHGLLDGVGTELGGRYFGEYRKVNDRTKKIARVIQSAVGHAAGKRRKPVTLADKPFDHRGEGA